MKVTVFLFTVLTLTVAKPNGFYHQEYNYQTSSSSYRNHELQHKNDEQGYYSKDGDLEGRFRPKINAHSQHSEYVNPKLQHGYQAYADRSTSYGQLHAQNHLIARQPPFDNPEMAVQYGGIQPGGPTYGVNSNLRQITMNIQQELARELQRAVSEHYRRTSAYSNHISQAQIQADMRALEEELRRNVTMRLENALKSHYGNQGIRGAYSYTILNGRLQPTANYHNQELADLTRQMEAELMRELQQQVQHYYHTQVKTEVHTQHTTYHQQPPNYPAPLQQRPPATGYHHPYPLQPVPIHQPVPMHQPVPVHQPVQVHQPVHPIPDSITTVATRVQTELNEHLNRILEDTERRYFSQQNHHHISVHEIDRILVQLQQELRTNITVQFDEAIKRAYGFSNYASKYSVEDIENLRRQIETNLITKLNRDFNKQKEKYFQTLHTFTAPQNPSNFVYYPENTFHHQADTTAIQRQLQETLSRQLNEALMQHQYRQAHNRMYAASTFNPQASYQASLSQLTAELNRNLTRQLEQFYNNQHYQAKTAQGAQLANIRNQLQHDLMRQLEQGLQQSYSRFSSWSSSSSTSSNYRPVRGYDPTVYRSYGTSGVATGMGEDCMMGDDPSVYQQQTDEQNDHDLTQQVETLDDLTQQTQDLTQQTESNEDLTLTQQVETHDDLTQQQQDNDRLTQQSQDLTQQTEDLTEGLTQQAEDLTQQFETNQRLEDQTQKNQDLTQQIRDQSSHSPTSSVHSQHITPVEPYVFKPLNTEHQQPQNLPNQNQFQQPLRYHRYEPSSQYTSTYTWQPQQTNSVPSSGVVRDRIHQYERLSRPYWENGNYQRPTSHQHTYQWRPQYQNTYQHKPRNDQTNQNQQPIRQTEVGQEIDDSDLTQQSQDDNFGTQTQQNQFEPIRQPPSQSRQQQPDLNQPIRQTEVGQEIDDSDLTQQNQVDDFRSLQFGTQTQQQNKFEPIRQPPSQSRQAQTNLNQQQPIGQEIDDSDLTQQNQDDNFGTLQFGTQSQQQNQFEPIRQPQTNLNQQQPIRQTEVGQEIDDSDLTQQNQVDDFGSLQFGTQPQQQNQFEPIRQPPGLSRQPPGLTRQPPGLTRQPPGLTRQPPGLTRQPPGLTRQPPGLTRQPPGQSRQPQTNLDQQQNIRQTEVEQEIDDSDLTQQSQDDNFRTLQFGTQSQQQNPFEPIRQPPGQSRQPQTNLDQQQNIRQTEVGQEIDDSDLTQQNQYDNFGTLQFGTQPQQQNQLKPIRQPPSQYRKPQNDLEEETENLDLTQQTQNQFNSPASTQQLQNQFRQPQSELGQQTEDLDLTQQTEDLNLNQQTQDSGFGKLQTAQQTRDLTDSTHQTQDHLGQTEDLSLTRHPQDSDFTQFQHPTELQQQTQNADFGQLQTGNQLQRSNGQQTEDLTQQIQDENYDLTQQVQSENFGKLTHHPSNEDFTPQTQSTASPIPSNKINNNPTDQQLSQQTNKFIEQEQQFNQQNLNPREPYFQQRGDIPPQNQNDLSELQRQEQSLIEARRQSEQLIDALQQKVKQDQQIHQQSYEPIGPMQYEPKPVYSNIYNQPIQVGTTRQLSRNYKGNPYLHQPQEARQQNVQTETTRDIEPIEPQVANEVQEVDGSATAEVPTIPPEVITTEKPGWWSRFKNKAQQFREKIG